MCIALQTAWAAVPPFKLESLVASMPERINAVLEAKGQQPPSKESSIIPYFPGYRAIQANKYIDTGLGLVGKGQV
ncbi:MAG: hypothetical protein BJ554DRAFT_5021 [Olpidium bornovanus]|uniref:Uncharacterized protein n=1 Tax=Olpidium bornovanus TaxID=278681 RepID=A0A8H7ZJR4_9FUNG|nr:MAG: hypothetical protein BJ554DRAFT_5021 [Olpidium bornovanus]